jgi:O-antigen/teichoic acid export membrane protein
MKVGTFSVWWQWLTGRTEPTTDSGRRVVAVLRGMGTALASRVLGSALSLISIPLAIHHLGAEKNGVWVVLGTALGAFNAADLGFGFSAMNKVTGAMARGETEKARQIVSSGLVAMGSVALMLTLPLLLVLPWVDVAGWLGAKPELRSETLSAALVGLGLAVLNLPLGMVAKLFNACQKTADANMWGIVANVTGFLGMLAAFAFGSHLALLVILSFGGQTLVWLLASIWFFRKLQPELRPAFHLASRAEVNTLARLGWQFQFLQITSIISFGIDALVVAHFAGAAAVTPLSSGQKVFNIVSMIVGCMLPSLWTAFGDAHARHDHAWMRRVILKTTWFSLGVTTLVAVPLALVAQPLIRAWIHNEEAVPSGALLAWQCAATIIIAPASCWASALNSMSILKPQLWYGLTIAVVNFVLSVWWVQYYGAAGVMAGTFVSMLLVNTPCAIYLLRKTLWQDATKA